VINWNDGQRAGLKPPAVAGKIARIMLPVEEVIAFIRDSDPLVRHLALHYLEWVRSPDRLTGDFILDAIEAGHRELLRSLDDFTPSARVLNYAIQMLAKGYRKDDNMTWLTRVVERASDSLLTPQVIAAVRKLGREFLSFKAETELRLELMALPTAELREQFLRGCEEADKAGMARSEMHRVAALERRLLDRNDSVDWARAELQQRLGSNKWEETWLFSLLIESHDRSILETALERFAAADLEENEALALVLAQVARELCTADDLPRIAALWDKLGHHHQWELIVAIGKLRIPEAKPLLLKLTKETQDPILKTYGAIGLCEMLCTDEESLEFVREFVESELFEIEHVDLEELAIPLGIIVGRPFAEAPKWRERIADPSKRSQVREEIIRTNYPALAEFRDLVQEYKKGLPDQEESGNLAETIFPEEREVAQLTRANTVGRNDPCPCGSGKKYKKCCLGKES
jgi:hypothetical protein